MEIARQPDPRLGNSLVGNLVTDDTHLSSAWILVVEPNDLKFVSKVLRTRRHIIFSSQNASLNISPHDAVLLFDRTNNNLQLYPDDDFEHPEQLARRNEGLFWRANMRGLSVKPPEEMTISEFANGERPPDKPAIRGSGFYSQLVHLNACSGKPSKSLKRAAFHNLLANMDKYSNPGFTGLLYQQFAQNIDGSLEEKIEAFRLAIGFLKKVGLYYQAREIADRIADLTHQGQVDQEQLKQLFFDFIQPVSASMDSHPPSHHAIAETLEDTGQLELPFHAPPISAARALAYKLQIHNQDAHSPQRPVGIRRPTKLNRTIDFDQTLLIDKDKGENDTTLLYASYPKTTPEGEYINVSAFATTETSELLGVPKHGILETQPQIYVAKSNGLLFSQQLEQKSIECGTVLTAKADTKGAHSVVLEAMFPEGYLIRKTLTFKII